MSQGAEGERQTNIRARVGDIVEIAKRGVEPHDMMYCAPFLSVVMDVMPEHDGVSRMALCDSDEYTKRTGQVQAVSFKVWEPVDTLIVRKTANGND